MGGRDLIKPTGRELPPWIVIGKSEPRALTAAEVALFSKGDEELRDLEKQFEVNGMFIEPDDDDDEGFTRRMTGF